jgi:hypothetical protein
MAGSPINSEMRKKFDEITCIGNRAVRETQEDNRRRGIPNVYSINSVLYWELPDGTLSQSDPYDDATQTKLNSSC